MTTDVYQPGGLNSERPGRRQAIGDLSGVAADRFKCRDFFGSEQQDVLRYAAMRVATRAILFDLGNTLVGYYTSSEFPLALRRCLRECARALGQTEDQAPVLLESVVPKPPHDHLTTANLAGIIALLREPS